MAPSALSMLAATALMTGLCAQWQYVPAATIPEPELYGCTMAADDAGNSLLFGGVKLLNCCLTPFAETWQYAAGTWTQLATAGPHPAGDRSGHRMVFDSNRGLWVLYGGRPVYPQSVWDETWEFDGTTWTQRFPAATPGGLAGHGMCFDRARNVTVAYGGQQLFEYDGLTWVPRSPAHNPGFTPNCTMCYHQGLMRAVMFDSANGATWLWDGVDWTQLPATGPQPGSRTFAEMVFDPFRNVCILAGGRDPAGWFADDTWQFDGAQWSLAASGGALTYGFGMAFDVVDRVVVRFGGAGTASVSIDNDTWTWGATSTAFGSGCAGSNGVVTLQPADAPRIGQRYRQTLTQAASAFAIGALSLHDITPLSLASFGMPGCTAYINPDALVPIGQSAGVVGFDIVVPAHAWLLGTQLFAQGLSIDPGVNPAWLVTSNATRGLVGF